MIIISKEQRDLYCSTVERLTRIGLKDPTRQIIALAEEIDQNRQTIQALRYELDQNRQTIQALRYELDKPPVPLKSIDEVHLLPCDMLQPLVVNKRPRRVWIGIDLARNEDLTAERTADGGYLIHVRKETEK